MADDGDLFIVTFVGAIVFFVAVYGFDIAAIVQWNSIRKVVFDQAPTAAPAPGKPSLRAGASPYYPYPYDPYFAYYQWRLHVEAAFGIFFGLLLWSILEYYVRYKTTRCLLGSYKGIKVDTGLGGRFDVVSTGIALALLAPAALTIATVFSRGTAKTLKSASKAFVAYHVVMFVLKILVSLFLVLLSMKSVPAFLERVPCIRKMVHGPTSQQSTPRTDVPVAKGTFVPAGTDHHSVPTVVGHPAGAVPPRRRAP